MPEVRHTLKRVLPAPVVERLRRARRGVGAMLSQPTVDAAVDGALALVERRQEERLEKLRTSVDHRLQERAAATDALVLERIDEVLAEIRTARGAVTELEHDTQRMRDDMARVLRENAALLRLAAGDRRVHDPAAGNGAAELPEGSTWKVDRDLLFSELERGSREEIVRRLRRYVPYLRGHGPIVDLGCGRGELLEVAASAGIEAYGVDSDAESVEVCHQLGFDARWEDLFAHLSSLPDATVGGVVSTQVVEHLPAQSIEPLFTEIARVLTPGGVVMIETPNPASFATHVHSFWRDPTHTRPVPAPALGFAARTAGLVVDEVVYTAPPPDEERLQPLAVPAAGAADATELREVVGRVNHNLEQLNELLYGPQDYALIAHKPE